MISPNIQQAIIFFCSLLVVVHIEQWNRPNKGCENTEHKDVFCCKDFLHIQTFK